MFQVNDLIVYGNHGVCKVENVGTLSISMADKQKQYYTLRPVYQHEAVIYAPVDNNKTIMRFVLSKEEVENLIKDIPNIDSAWIVNEREREMQYRAAMQTGDCRELIKIIKTLYQRKKSRIQDGKKVTVVDEKYFRQAEEQLYGELAFALEMPKEQVGAYITESIREKK